MSAPPAGGRTLRASGSSIKRDHIVWNEDNLKENEVIQAEIPHGKITEPKTPYHPPLDDSGEDVPPLDLDGPPLDASDGRPIRTSDPKKFAEARKEHYHAPVNLKELLSKKVVDEDEE